MNVNLRVYFQHVVFLKQLQSGLLLVTGMLLYFVFFTYLLYVTDLAY